MHPRYFLIAVLLLALATTARADDGDWFIVTSKNKVYTNNPKHPVYKVLSERGQKSGLNCAAFNVQDEWVTFDGPNFVQTCNNNIAPGKRIMELGKAGDTFRWLAFSPTGGWVLLHGKNAFSADGIPDSLNDKLKDAIRNDEIVRSVAISPQGGWVIVLADGFGTSVVDIPKALKEALDRCVFEKKTPPRCVAFTTTGEWFVVSGKNEYQTSKPDHPAAKKLAELGKAGETINWIAFAPGDSPQGYFLQRDKVRRVHATLEYAVEEPAGGIQEFILYAAKAPNLDRQREVETTLTPAGKLAADLSPLKRGLLQLRVKGQPKGTTATLTIDATLYATKMRPRLPSDPLFKEELDADAIKNYTRPTETLDFKTKAFQDWLDKEKLRRGSSESAFDFAKRVYAVLKPMLKYERDAAGDFRASAVCKTAKSDCAGMAFLYTATLRANNVPARALPGRIAESEKQLKPNEPPDTQRHVRAEFFAKGIGWVPVDVAFAAGDPGRGLYGWFGHDPGDLIVMHIDADVVMDSIVAGNRSAITLQTLAMFRKGGTGANEQLRDRWIVK